MMHAPLAPSLQVEWRLLDELRDIAADWRALAARALAPNVFYEPAFALAAAPVFGRDAIAGLVWSRLPTPRLLGLFPVRVEPRRFGIPLPLVSGWTHAFAPLGTPLIDRDAAEAVIAAWLTAVQGNAALPAALLMPYMPEDGPLAEAFDAALARCGMREARFGAHRRALLAPQEDGAHYLEHAIAGRKRKELRRQARRLDERGAVTVAASKDPSAIAAALRDFLALEASGWKGRAGSAARDDAPIRHFMQAAVDGLAAEGKAALYRLCSGGRPIASGIVLRSGVGAWFWKIAYDEGLARFSPGVLITLELTDALLADPSVAFVDSCATSGHAMIDHLWRERLALSDRLILTRPQARARFEVVCGLEGLRRKAISAAKAVRNRIRRAS
jgi:CelD/BcsL family acetyltransferase involved in cellulose biosynthesis